MDWINNFYSRTGEWWGTAESVITKRDNERVALLGRIHPAAKNVLELGSGYGNTAAATAKAGLNVVAVELSDRISFAKRFEDEKAPGSLNFIKGDFYEVDVESQYDVVAYWNGFGIGSDSDQRRLLRRIAKEWLKPDGKALIDIGNPFVRASWAGEREHKDPSPERGYEHSVDELTDYDPVNNRFVDTWWADGQEESKLTQTLRNYTPADLMLLLEGTGLKLESIYAGGKKFDPHSDQTGNRALLTEEQEYLAVLTIE